ncbi:hypothetical protein ACJIZ3_003175 [Penstemon smallii]|uniref:K Homology domain-containing protein n=1 Tax=Penstemon smallii TaxID=265156 RepID=A0ABD3U9N8_9LAMI
METGNAVVSLPKFEPLKAHEMSCGHIQFRKLPVPAHRRKLLHKNWRRVYDLVHDVMKVDIRTKLTKPVQVQLKTKPDTPEIGHLQKCADFIHAILLGFEVEDAEALLRMDELYVDSFDIKDVKVLRGDHLSRAIGRLSGKNGRTKHAIENATKARIVIADTRIHIMGTFTCIKIARNCLCSLILGSPAPKVYSKLQQLASKIA